MGFYEDMAQTARDLLAPTDAGGLGQGTIALVRYVPGAPSANPWDPPATPSREVTVLDGALDALAARLAELAG